METNVLRQLITIGQQMAQTRELDPLLNYAVDVALELLNGQFGYLVLVDDDYTLKFHVHRDRQGNIISDPESQVSTTIIHKVIETQTFRRTASAAMDPDFENSDSVVALKLRSVLCVPLIAQGTALGVIYLENREYSNLFRAEDIEPLQHLASYAAVCIQNTMLNQELRTALRQNVHQVSASLRDGAIQEARALALEQERARITYNFIQDASHQVRTPLSIIKTSTDLLGRKIDLEQHGNYLERIDTQVDTIVQLVDSLNLMAKLDSGIDWTIYFIDLNFIVRDVCESISQVAQLHDKAFHYTLPDDKVMVRGVAEYLRQAIKAVLENALQYTSEDGEIRVYLDTDDTHAILRIEDDGAGIPPEDIEKVHLRFYRGDKAGTTSGLGLGLSIAERVMDLHNGHLNITSQLDLGTTVELVFPLDD